MNYLEYLKKRKSLGKIYRDYYLYPKIQKFTVGLTLDFGCGIGDFLKFYRNSIGADINPQIIGYCREQGLNAEVFDEVALRYENQFFQSIVMDNVLEHLIDPSLVISEFYRVLANSGNLVIGIPGDSGYQSDADHKINYSEQDLLNLFTRSNFRLINKFYTPFGRNEWLNKHMKLYCRYYIFKKITSNHA
jgi:SAM-dependent methyltransferase